jgi:DNA-directed RNA polymerase subunit omega
MADSMNRESLAEPGSRPPGFHAPGSHTPPLDLRTMIEALKSDEIVNKLGGRFKLTALVQRRLRELIIDGARPLVERDGRTDLELVIEEILQEKITPDWSDSSYDPKQHK